MVVKEDGTKWACQACLKGHRVSGCTHKDRDLIFVPKKGRPVTQCPHCRVERKKRAAHVKCECGDKAHSKDKCVHLRDAEARLAEHYSTDLEPLPEHHDPDNVGCCCLHGGRCTCASVARSEASDDALDPAHASHSRNKPRLTSTQSDGHLTLFSNGHHMPVHRSNNAAHELGLPYKIHRSQTAHAMPIAARRSVDSSASASYNEMLPWPQQWPQVSGNLPLGETGTALPQSGTSSPHLIYQGSSSVAGDPHVQATTVAHSVVSETMPSVSSNNFQGFGFLPQSDMSGATMTGDALLDAWSMPASSLSLGQNDNLAWSDVDWNTWNISANQQPALTHASSGTMSEVDELPILDDMTFAPHLYGQGFSTQSLQGLNNAIAPNALPRPSSLPQNSRWSLPIPGPSGQNAFAFSDYANLDMDDITSPMDDNVATTSSNTFRFMPELSRSDVPALSSMSSLPDMSISKQGQGSDPDWNTLFQQNPADDMSSYRHRPLLYSNITASSSGQISSFGGNSAVESPNAGAIYDNAYQPEDEFKPSLSSTENGNVSPTNQSYLNMLGFENDFSSPGLPHTWAS